MGLAMIYEFSDVPREFTPRQDSGITLRDMGKIQLESDEMITFVDDQGNEVDFTKKSWGYYPLPSVNGRLKDNGFKTALVRNELSSRLYVMIVQKNRISDFENYCKNEDCVVEMWLEDL